MTFMQKIAVAGIAAVVLAGALVPAEAMPRLVVPSTGIDASLDVTTVQYRRHGGGYYNGHRGYRDYRPGYRHYDGYWYPLAAFGAGALIGGALAAPTYELEPRVYVEPEPRYVAPAPRYVERGDINPRHYEWCYNRYRSYDSYSNTFQPNYGPRQECLSPYY